MSMFCNQCEQAKGGVGCDVAGVCGKLPDVSALQDLLVFGLEGISVYAEKARALGAKDAEIDLFVLDGLFTTVTNVNFDPARLRVLLQLCHRLKEKARGLYEQAYKAKTGSTAPPVTAEAAAWTPPADLAGLVAQGEAHGLSTFHPDADVRSAKEILLYGLKGMAAYADHASILGSTDEEIFAFTHKALAALADPAPGLMD